MEDLEDKKIVAVTMVDKSAAFNVCRHKIILSKLKLVGLDSVDWLASYVSGRTQSTALGSTKSTAIHLPPASVVQGGVRSGILYNVMTCDLPDVIHTNRRVSLKDVEQHCVKDGDMVTFVYDAKSYFGHQDSSDKNFKSIENICMQTSSR